MWLNRINSFTRLAAVVLLGGALAAPVSGQRPDTMLPEDSAAKAKQILQELINALGGPGYTQVRGSQCQGQRAQFGHNGEPMGYVAFTEDRQYPDKLRVEYSAKSHNLKSILNTVIGVDGLDLSHGGVIVAVYNGDHGWTLDRSGVSDLPADAVADFQEQVKRNIGNLLRFRLNENGMTIRYGGNDTADRREVEWVELTDSEDRTFRLAVERSTHLLIRSVVITENQETHERDEDVSIYTKYQLKDSVWTPLTVTREHNDRMAAQFFYDTCKYDPGFPSDLFDKSSLQKRGGDGGAKKK